MYRDSHGMTLAIGKKLGGGGEGAVFVTSDTGLAAKIYSRPLTQVQFAKLQAMVSVCDDTLRSVAAWPVGIVYLGSRPVGFTMPRLTAQVPLHELFGPKRRHMLFPDAHWTFLVHTALNVSRAFDVAHARDIVVGDVNSNKLVVYRDSKTNFIATATASSSLPGGRSSAARSEFPSISRLSCRARISRESTAYPSTISSAWR
jgi:DNA-binding helix-hairpin-helix protein with protein kinase domain